MCVYVRVHVCVWACACVCVCVCLLTACKVTKTDEITIITRVVASVTHTHYEYPKFIDERGVSNIVLSHLIFSYNYNEWTGNGY